MLTYLSAFESYPKLMQAFSDKKTRLLALEATLRYYTAFDLRYGSGFSLDENVREAVLIIHSDRMKYTFLKHLAAGSYGKEYRAVISKLSKEEEQHAPPLQELDRLEATVDIPRPHIYADFLGVASEYQHQGRGRKLMSQVCRYADQIELPIMLFTNTADDIKFYQSLGFRYNRRDIVGKIRLCQYLYAVRIVAQRGSISLTLFQSLHHRFDDGPGIYHISFYRLDFLQCGIPVSFYVLI